MSFSRRTFYQDFRKAYVEYNENDYEIDPAEVQKKFDENKNDIFAEIEANRKSAAEEAEVDGSETDDQAYKLSEEEKKQIEASEKENIYKQLKT